MTPAEEGYQPLIFVIFGPGGVGKGTLVAELLRLRPGLWLSRSWTTRARRDGESAEAYVFATEDAFRARIAAGGFLEYNEFAANGCLYGTPALEPPPGQDVILEIDVNGAAQVVRRYPGSVPIFIAAPSREEQAQRLRARGDDEESIERRLALGADEDRLGRQMAAHVVVNDDLSRATLQLAGIIDYRRRQVGR